MIDADSFMKNSPFQVTHQNDAAYNLNNTTPDLLKFQLQDEYRNKISDLKNNFQDLPNLNLLNSNFLQGSFNNHLQTSVTEIPSLSSTPTSSDSNESTSTPQPNHHPNYLNLKILIENSVFDTSKINKDSILSLSNLNNLKKLISDKKELQNYLNSRILISNQFTDNIISNQNQIDLDSSLLIKILKSNQALQSQLLSINQEVDYLTNRLNNHNLACLVLGYVEDVHLSTTGASNQIQAISSDTPMSSELNSDVQYSNNLFENLFSHIAAIAAQRNITLPSPPSSSSTSSSISELKINWAQNCIDTILSNGKNFPGIDLEPETPTREQSHDRGNSVSNSIQDASFLSASPYKSYNCSNDKVMQEYKTALTDLRFSHHYLMKEYEISKDNSSKLIQEYRKKISTLEKELKSHQSNPDISGSILSTNDSFSSATTNWNNDYDNINSKDKEISRLRKELNLLKIDKLGHPRNNSQIFSSSPRHNNLSPSSSHGNISSPPPMQSSLLLDNDTLEPPSHDDEMSELQSLSSAMSTTRPTSAQGSSMSNGILRKEFKKIVGDIQDQYELELSEEKLKRRQLQEQLAKLQNGA